MREISKLAKNMVPSTTVELKARITEMKRQGIDVVSLTSGEPDFETPAHIREALCGAVESGKTRYTPAAGILPLRQAICDTLLADHGLEYRPNQVCVSTGAKQAIYNAALAICDPGDEIILPTPCWVSYTEQIKMAGGRPVLVEMPKEEGYRLDVGRIAAAVTERTRGLILNNPNNPTGAVYESGALRELAELASEQDFTVISDEIYEKLIYDGEARFVSFPSISEDAYRRTILINGCSKTYSMTGFRIGFAAGSPDYIRAMSSIQGHTTYGANTMAQYAALAAYGGPQDSVETMRREFDRRRIWLTDRLNQIEGITCRPVQGAFYVLPDVSHYFGKYYRGRRITDSAGFCEFILEEARVGLVPGDAYYAPGHVRISYSSALPEIKGGVERIEAALQML